MQVKNGIYYHTHRMNRHSENWQVGNVLQFGRTYNYYFDELMKSVDEIYRDHKGKSFFDENGKWIEQERSYWLKASGNNSEDQWTILEHLTIAVEKVHDLNWHLQKHRQLLFEMIFENVRSLHFAELPSRQRCLWVCDEKHVQVWKDLFDGSKQRIYKLKLTGSIHAVDGSLIASDAHSLKDFEHLAFRYWNSETNDDVSAQQPELVFEGACEILEAYHH